MNPDPITMRQQRLPRFGVMDHATNKNWRSVIRDALWWRLESYRGYASSAESYQYYLNLREIARRMRAGGVTHSVAWSGILADRKEWEHAHSDEIKAAAESAAAAQAWERRKAEKAAYGRRCLPSNPSRSAAEQSEVGSNELLGADDQSGSQT